MNSGRLCGGTFPGCCVTACGTDTSSPPAPSTGRPPTLTRYLGRRVCTCAIARATRAACARHRSPPPSWLGGTCTGVPDVNRTHEPSRVSVAISSDKSTIHALQSLAVCLTGSVWGVGIGGLMLRPTMWDICKASGGSQGAVSYALNGRPGVSEKPRARILGIAHDLGWAPNGPARALSPGGRVG